MYDLVIFYLARPLYSYLLKPIGLIFYSLYICLKYFLLSLTGNIIVLLLSLYFFIVHADEMAVPCPRCLVVCGICLYVVSSIVYRWICSKLLDYEPECFMKFNTRVVGKISEFINETVEADKKVKQKREEIRKKRSEQKRLKKEAELQRKLEYKAEHNKYTKFEILDIEK